MAALANLGRELALRQNDTPASCGIGVRGAQSIRGVRCWGEMENAVSRDSEEMQACSDLSLLAVISLPVGITLR